jgi:hypothetical protein
MSGYASKFSIGKPKSKGSANATATTKGTGKKKVVKKKVSKKK